jgi:hypothetical protein
MKHNQVDTIVLELKRHMPFTLAVSFLAGIVIATLFVLNNNFVNTLGGWFEIAHPAHVLVSAAATAAIYRKYKPGILMAGIIGVMGALLIGTLSDVLVPWLAGNLLSLDTVLHLPLIDEPLIIFGAAILGSVFGISVGLFKLNHSLHIFLSVFASMFYLLAFSVNINFLAIIIITAIVFFAVYVPCCISDIVFPILFIKKPCSNCGHWHD